MDVKTTSCAYWAVCLWWIVTCICLYQQHQSNQKKFATNWYNQDVCRIYESTTIQRISASTDIGIDNRASCYAYYRKWMQAFQQITVNLAHLLASITKSASASGLRRHDESHSWLRTKQLPNWMINRRFLKKCFRRIKDDIL